MRHRHWTGLVYILTRDTLSPAKQATLWIELHADANPRTGTPDNHAGRKIRVDLSVDEMKRLASNLRDYIDN